MSPSGIYRRTDSNNADFIALVKMLDEDLAMRDGKDHGFYAQYNKIDLIKHTVVAYLDGQPVACGAMKQFDPVSTEIKRMYTIPALRGGGMASGILRELETWAIELGYINTVLETGKRQPEAISLYQKNGYAITPNYGQYAGIENSVCFIKKLN